MAPNELAEAVELDNSAQDQGAEQTPAKSPDAGIVDDTDTEDQATQEDEEDEAETDQEDATEDDSDEDAEDQPPKKSKKRSAQARINEMRRRQAEAEREAAYWRGVAEAAKAKPEQQAQQAANAADPGIPPTRPAPTLEDHDYDQAAWVQDYTNWTIEQNQAKPRPSPPSRQPNRKPYSKPSSLKSTGLRPTKPAYPSLTITNRLSLACPKLYWTQRLQAPLLKQTSRTGYCIGWEDTRKRPQRLAAYRQKLKPLPSVGLTPKWPKGPHQKQEAPFRVSP
jgi:hypothetical protein